MGLSTERPDSARNKGLPVPTAMAAQPGATSSSVAIAMAVGMGCQRYGLTAVGTSMGPGVLRANAMQVAIASRYPRCSATHRLFAPAATARSASAIASRVGAKPSKLTPMRTVMLAYAPLRRKDRSPDEQSDIWARPAAI